MAEIKTRVNDVSVDDFLAAVPDETRREDARAVSAMMARVTGQPAKMWGPSIVGFGSYSYTYESGHSGSMCRIGFSPRKAQLVLYGGFLRETELLEKLGKHDGGKGCLYIKKLANVDMAVLEAMTRAAWDHMNATHPDP
jgi:Domain of unknown function (DU1801)